MSVSPTLLVRDVFSDAKPFQASSDAPVESGAFVSFSDPPQGGQPCVVDVLAAPESARAAVYGVVVDEGLDPSFPGSVRDEVAAILRDPGIDDDDLQDLTSLPFVTIDGAHTRDLDQALWIERSNGGYVVWYALADASFYVRPGTALFEEALRRGASYYLPGFVVPMLPRELSENLISLNPGVVRRATVFRMELDAKARCLSTKLLRARIRSAAKLTFDEVESFYDAPDASTLCNEAFAESLRLLRDVGLLRIVDAEGRDVVRYRRTEVDVGLDEQDGLRFVVVDDMRRDVERYNEQVSLHCNIEGARYLFEGDAPDDAVQPIYRVHPRPRPERIHEFEQLLVSLAREHGLDAAAWTWKQGRGTSLAAFLQSLPSDGPQASVARAVHRQAIMLNLRSSFSEQPGQHYGVGAELYARFSSPMREVVGVFVHKEAWEKADGRCLPPRWNAPSADTFDDDQLREAVVRNANRAKDLQKSLDKLCNGLVIDRMLARDLALEPDQRPVRSGVVMGLTSSKAHVLLDEPHLDVKVYAAQVLGADGTSWRDEHGARVLRLGDPVKVRLVDRDERHQRWILGIV